MAKPKSKPKYNSRQLTNHLRELAAEVHDWEMEDDGEGRVITKGEALARLLWQRALGYDEVKVDDEGREKRIKHDPAQWAIQLIYERMEGRSPQAIAEDENRRRAKDKVSDLAKARVNELAAQATTPEPPRRRRRRPKKED